MMLLPILQAAQEQYPEHEFCLVSRPYLAPVFDQMKLQFMPAALHKRLKGIKGLYVLANEIRLGQNPDIVIDAHQVLRSKLINILLRLMGTKIYRIKKNRKERAGLTRKKGKVLRPIKPVYQLYLDAFEKAGIPIQFDPKNSPIAPHRLMKHQESWWQNKKGGYNIGIAPLAAHKAKQWPLEKMRSLMQSLGVSNVKLFLFGSVDERAELEKLALRSGAHCEVVAGKFSLDQELALIKKMNLMVTMDSSNMHMAAWAGTKVISLWGATHPYAGFKAYRQSDLNQLGVSHRDLSCRPCSVYGNKECWRGDYACLEGLKHTMVRNHINRLISES